MEKNQVVVVTGASSGIGKACVDILLNQGVKVAGWDVTDQPARENYVHQIVDVRKESAISDALKDVKARFGKIDGLVNCAGVFSCSKPFYEMDLAEWNRVIDTNLTGTFLVSRQVCRTMMEQKKGKIVNISCIRGKIFRLKMAEYAASKGGVDALTSAMALDLAPFNIRVNAVAPGFTYTGITKTSFAAPGAKEQSESLIPVGRIAQPEDIARVVQFLLTDAADYINGTTIYADGGYSIAK
jgi:NAD(P)-dependent dehydrogenase (short-subunit alcohol dehydrogenase family)